jgi:hypothetical protein
MTLDSDEPERVDPKPVPAEDEPLTTDQLVASFERLVARGRKAGLRPIQTLASTYLRKATDALDGLLSGIEGDKKE